MEWLDREGLLKHDNTRSLPLKKGGATDVYVNVRNARSSPAAIVGLVDLFAPVLRWLNPDLFIEVPDSVSCIAGSLSLETGIPYATIRDEAKEGRVTDAKFIGNAKRGQRVVIIDDVITNGASKAMPYRVCREKGLEVVAIVVLVDRQQGWQDDFARLDVDAPVWAGMTLHDVRRELVESGLMDRCDHTVAKQNPLIVALDGKRWDEVLPIVDQLRTTGCIFKVNDLLVGQGIASLMPELDTYGRVMADLKAHDIPNTVENICRQFGDNQPWAITVHASGGADMVRAARNGLPGWRHNIILAVTVLTSFNPETCEEIYHRRPLSQVKALAQVAMNAGADGLVCSPQEVRHLRKEFPEALLVTPGVRSAGKDTQDQKRVDTPANTIKNGASHLVMGRQILGAPDPVAEVKRILRDELLIAAFDTAEP